MTINARNGKHFVRLLICPITAQTTKWRIEVVWNVTHLLFRLVERTLSLPGKSVVGPQTPLLQVVRFYFVESLVGPCKCPCRDIAPLSPARGKVIYLFHTSIRLN